MKTEQEIKNELSWFCGSETISHLPYGYGATEGIVYLINNADCLWMFTDLIAKIIAQEIDTEFLIVRIKKDNKGGCVVDTRTDTDEPIQTEQKYIYTDFPLDSFEFYLCGYVFLLKSEY